ncbi:MAG: hypothetical protein JZU64_12410 [Rhodoferax sp.]|nr:hypothetical protein [Rhodoferax sp.]
MASSRKAKLLARVDSLLEFFLVEVCPFHGGYQAGPKVFECWMIGSFHEIFLKAGVESHQLMDEVCHLHELEIVLEGGVAFACVLMRHAIAAVLQGVEALVLLFSSAGFSTWLVPTMLRSLTGKFVM